MKKIFFFLLLVAVVSAILFVFFHKKENKIILFGNVEIRSSDLSFRVKGRLSKLYKEEGDEVMEGELLAELDNEPYKASFFEKRAQVVKQRAEKYKREKIYKFNKPLCEDFTVSKEECSNLENDFKFAKGEYDESVAKFENAVIDLDDTKLYAPYRGIILSRIREKGTMVDSSSVIYSISMIEPVFIRAYIEEPDLGKVKLGQKALIYTDSRPKNPYLGHIGFISPVAEFTPKTVETTTLRGDLVYRVRIIIDNTDLYLRQGMPVTIEVLEDENS